MHSTVEEKYIYWKTSILDAESKQNSEKLGI
jgi:hypothetical protein